MADVALIAGASGFVGRHLSHYLAEIGIQVIGLDRHPSPMAYGYCKAVDLTDRVAVLDALKDIRPRWVFNLTGVIDHTIKWPDQRDIMNQHVLAVINLVEALRDKPPESFVNVGSSDEYGDQHAPQHENMREKPIAPYSAAKVAATHYLQMWFRRTGFPSVVARFYLVYGPSQGVERLIPWAITSLLRGETMPASAGLQKRDFLYVRDAVMALVALAGSEATRGGIFNVASGHPVTVREVLETIRYLAGRGTINFGARPMREGEIMELYADISSIQRITGWSPTTSLEDGLRQTIEFYKVHMQKTNEQKGPAED